MNLVNKVLTILNSMLPPANPVEGVEYLQTVMYDSGFSANVRIDKKPCPMALFYLINDWNIDLSKTTSVKEEASIQVFFADVARFDQKGEEKDVIVNRMKLLAREFIKKVLEDKSIRVVDDKVKIQSSYGSFDKFVVGVSVSFKIEEKQPTCL